MGIWDKVVARLIFVLKLLLYPIHFLFRVLARSLLIVLTTGLVPLSFFAVVVLAIASWEWLETERWKDIGGIAGTISLITLLGGMGILANFLKQ